MGMRHAVTMLVGFRLLVVVPVVVVDVAVCVPVHDAVGMGVRVRVVVAGLAGFGPFRHTVRFGPNVGKARLTNLSGDFAMAATRKKTTKKKATKKKSTRTYSPAASEFVREEMEEMKAGKLRSGGSGKKVTDRKQAIAIALSEARRAGKKVPAAKKKSP
jgi:hypothetical protein